MYLVNNAGAPLKEILSQLRSSGLLIHRFKGFTVDNKFSISDEENIFMLTSKRNQGIH